MKGLFDGTPSGTGMMIREVRMIQEGKQEAGMWTVLGTLKGLESREGLRKDLT